jgi:hypothetical protein
MATLEKSVAAARQQTAVLAKADGGQNHPQQARVSGWGRMGETSGIKSERWRSRSPQGGVNPYHAGARGGQERPGAGGAATGAWWSQERRDRWGSCACARKG